MQPVGVFAPAPVEIIIILFIVLLIFGPKRLPDLGRSLGGAMREFKDSVTGKDKDELPAGEAGAEKPDEQPEPVKSATAGEQKT